MIYLMHVSYFMYCLKTTTKQKWIPAMTVVKDVADIHCILFNVYTTMAFTIYEKDYFSNPLSCCLRLYSHDV